MTTKGAVFGFVDRIALTGSAALISGWARQPDLNVPAEKIIIRNTAGEFIAESILNVARPDVAAQFNCPALINSGWLIQIDLAQFYKADGIKAYASSGSSEHRLSGNPPPERQYPKMLGGFDLKELIARGLTVGSNFSMQPDCFIDYSHCWLINIGDNVIFAPRVQVIAHDTSLFNHCGSVKIGLINIRNNVFIGNGAIVLLGVTIGDNCIIGAGSVISKDIPAGSVAAGNPARVICKTSELIEKNLSIDHACEFDNSFTIENKITAPMKKSMTEALKASGGIGFIRRSPKFK